MAVRSTQNAVYNSCKMENSMPVHASDFDKMCRTCLSTQKIQPLFALKYNETAIVSLLDSCASVHVEQDDDLPQNLCSACLQEIIKIHIFQEKCRQNETLLRAVLTEAKVLKQDVDDETIKPDEKFDIPTNYSDSDSETNTAKPVRRKIKKESKPVSCRDCSKQFASRDELKEHRREAKHTEVRNHTCPVCAKMFTSSKLRQHMRAHTKEKPYKCSVCSQGFSMSGNLKRHMMTHTGERPHVCEFCGKGFIQATSLQIHLRTHATCERTENPKFACSVCGRGFKRLNPYNIHLKKHFVEKLEEKREKVVKEEVREHVCDVCKRAYRTKHLLKTHLLTHGEKTFLCSDCGKGFVTKAALQSHLKVHTGERPHTCSFCKKSFAHVGSFDAHMLIHMGRKPYRCDVCTKSFTQLSHLKYHLRTHSGERPYRCTYCGKSFALKGNLTVHIRTHTGETPYICSVCGKGFYDSSSMKKHQKGHSALKVQQSDEIDDVVGDLGINL